MTDVSKWIFNFHSYLPIYFDVCFCTEAFEILGQESAREVDVQGLQYPYLLPCHPDINCGVVVEHPQGFSIILPSNFVRRHRLMMMRSNGIIV